MELIAESDCIIYLVMREIFDGKFSIEKGFKARKVQETFSNRPDVIVNHVEVETNIITSGTFSHISSPQRRTV